MKHLFRFFRSDRKKEEAAPTATPKVSPPAPTATPKVSPPAPAATPKVSPPAPAATLKISPPKEAKPTPKPVSPPQTPVAESPQVPFQYYRDLSTAETFSYRFRTGEELFPKGMTDLAFPEMFRDFRIVANLCRHILDLGGTVSYISIGGGSTDVTDTGTVAYDQIYHSAEDYFQNCKADWDAAHQEARKEYGSWYSGLDYHDFYVLASLNGANISLRLEDCRTLWVEISRNAEEAADFYRRELLRRFGAEGFDPFSVEGAG